MNRNSNGYEPRPVDTSMIDVPAELQELVETIARNTHDVWAVGKMKAGYTFGEKGSEDGSALHHPDLMPYEELSEQAKSYDRNTSMETVKLLLALGWKLTPPAR